MLNEKRQTFCFWLEIWQLEDVQRFGFGDYIRLGPLHVIAFRGLDVYLRHLGARGADLKSRDSDARTPLSYATQAAKLRMVKLLLSQSADPCSINSQGIAPMHYAARANHADIAKCLLQAGADPLIMTPEPSNGR